jgi:hypothetical protein
MANKGLVTLLGTPLIAGAINSKGDSEGWLNITNKVNSANANAMALHYLGYTEGANGEDVPFSEGSSGSIIYSQLNPTNTPSKLVVDGRDVSSSTPFHFAVGYNGEVTTPRTNKVHFGFTQPYTFDNFPNMTLRVADSNWVANGAVYDLRAIAQTNGSVRLADLQGTNPRNYFIIDFDPLVPNQPPVSLNSTNTGNRYSARAGSFNVSDVDGSVTNVALVSGAPANFFVNGTNWNWTPVPGTFPGTNNVMFYAQDNNGATSGTNTLSLVSTNTLPYATNMINLPGVIAETAYNIALNGADQDGDVLTYNLVTPLPLGGNLEGIVGTTNNIGVYKGKTNYYGPESFVYNVSDGYETGTNATVSFIVNPLNREPLVKGIVKNGNNAVVSADIQPNRNHELMRSYNLSDSNAWESVGSYNMPFSEIPMQSYNFVDGNATNDKAFYRVKSLSP